MEEEVARTPQQKRKPLTRSQRIAKNLNDRERRARQKVILQEKGHVTPRDRKRSISNAKRAVHARVVVAKLAENPNLSFRQAAVAAGLPQSVADRPSLITSTPEFAKLLDEYLPQGEILAAHRGLLKAAQIDHMIFADGPRNESGCDVFIAERNAKYEGENPYTRDDVLTDDDIREMLADKNCTVRKISRTEQSRHVYFFSPDNRARKDALDMAYKLRGSYAADKAQVAFSLVALANASRAALKEPDTAEEGRIMPRADDSPQLPRAV